MPLQISSDNLPGETTPASVSPLTKTLQFTIVEPFDHYRLELVRELDSHKEISPRRNHLRVGQTNPLTLHGLGSERTLEIADLAIEKYL